MTALDVTVLGLEVAGVTLPKEVNRGIVLVKRSRGSPTKGCPAHQVDSRSVYAHLDTVKGGGERI